MAQDPKNKGGKSKSKSKWNWTEKQDGTCIGSYGHVYYVSQFNKDDVYLTGTSELDYLYLPDDGTTPPKWSYPVIVPATSKL